MNKNDRNIYLSNMEVEEAAGLFFGELDEADISPLEENIEIINSMGRITAETVFAKLSSPNFNASAMDGIAVKAKATFGASEAKPLELSKDKDFVYVDTGDPISDPYDAVIMIEDVVEIDENTVEIIKAASSWQHVRPIGEDIVAHEMIIPINHEIRPVDIAAMLSGGLTQIKVYKKPRVALIPTGTEIIEPGERIEIGKIIESNSRMFEGMVRELGGEPVRYKPVIDDYQLLKQAIIKAAEENDIVIVNAGSSAGSEDFTVSLVSELGKVLVHGIATKPGKPAILGFVNNKPIIGIPGYPVSAYLVFDIFAKPLIKKYLKQPVPKEEIVRAVVSKRLVSSLKHREYVRIKLGRVENNLIATPLSRGAGVTMSLVRADGILIIPQNSEGLEAGEEVEVRLLKKLTDIDNTIVSIGSHDLAMDIISSLIHRRNPEYSLSSAHVGSMGGIMAIRRGEAHMAPIHLLDEESGVYNIAFVKRYLGNMDVAIIKGIKRIQGMIIKPGNPKNINSIKDIAREDVVFVNRQRGAGTRLLADYLFKQQHINTEDINGYDREMTTHMAVAAAVSSGTADVGLGVYSAAKALDLDFLPIGDEEYDFAVPVKYLNDNMIKLFIEILTSDEFKKELEGLGGYSTVSCGDIIYIK